MFSYETQGTNTYLVYEITNDSEIDTLCLGMLINNKINGFAPAFYTQVNNQKLLKYNVTAKIPCSQFFSETVNKRQMLGVFKSILSAINAAEEYMIEPNSIILDLDYIFVDVSSCSADMICLPSLENKNTDLPSFFKNIVFSTQYNQNENCDYVAQIISYLNSKAGFQVSEFNDLICTLDGTNGGAKPVQAASVKPPVQQTVAAMPQYAQKTMPEQKPVAEPPKNNSMPLNGNTLTGANSIPVQQPKPVMPQPVKAVTPPPQNTAPAAQQGAAGEDKISMMYLLMHYSKENKEKYKNQKKSNAAANNSGANNANTGFAIPGSQQSVVTPAANNTPSAIPVSTPAAAPKAVPTGGMPTNAGMPNAMNYSQSSPVNAVNTASAVPAANGGVNANFGETTVLNSKPYSGDTTILSEYNKKNETVPYLIRSKNKERIDLSKNIIRIGKERSFVDYFIGDNTAISRSHANIISKNGKVYILDTNSTNHTYVNGRMIQSNTEVELNHGDKVRLANEEFEFFMF